MVKFFRCRFLKTKLDPFLNDFGSPCEQIHSKNLIYECSYPPDYKQCLEKYCMRSTTFDIVRNNLNEIIFIDKLESYGKF